MTTRVPFDRAWRTTPERESLVAVAVPLNRDGKGTALTLKHDQSSTRRPVIATAAAGTKRSTSLKLTQGA